MFELLSCCKFRFESVLQQFSQSLVPEIIPRNSLSCLAVRFGESSHTQRCHTGVGQLILLNVLNTFSLWKGCVFHIGGYTGRGCFIYWRLCSIRGSRHAIELAAVPASLHQPLRHPRRRTHAVGCAGAVAFAVCGVLCQVSQGGKRHDLRGKSITLIIWRAGNAQSPSSSMSN